MSRSQLSSVISRVKFGVYKLARHHRPPPFDEQGIAKEVAALPADLFLTLRTLSTLSPTPFPALDELVSLLDNPFHEIDEDECKDLEAVERVMRDLRLISEADYLASALRTYRSRRSWT